MTNRGKDDDEDEKIWENESTFWIFHIKIRLCGNFHENPKKIFDPSFKTFLTNWGKNEDEEEKNWKNEIKFCILHIKIRLCRNFHENPRKKFLTHFFFWINARLIQGCCFLGKDLLMIKVVHMVLKNSCFIVYLNVESLPL